MSTDTETFSPPLVCLCGSTRFKAVFDDANARLTIEGYVVLTVGFFAGTSLGGRQPTFAEKLRLDDLHLRKIDLADEVLILNVGGYIGASTKRETWYAHRRGKKLRFLEPEKVSLADVESWFDGWAGWQAAAQVSARSGATSVTWPAASTR